MVVWTIRSLCSAKALLSACGVGGSAVGGVETEVGVAAVVVAVALAAGMAGGGVSKPGERSAP
jgi:hypothetical protein